MWRVGGGDFFSGLKIVRKGVSREREELKREGSDEFRSKLKLKTVVFVTFSRLWSPTRLALYNLGASNSSHTALNFVN